MNLAAYPYLKLYACLLLCCSLLPAPLQAQSAGRAGNSRAWVPLELILKYEPLSPAPARATQLLREYSQVEQTAQQLMSPWGVKLETVQPVYRQLLQQLTASGQTERALLERAGRAGKRPLSPTHFSRSLLLRFAYSRMDMPQLAQSLLASAAQWEARGLRLLEVSPNYLYKALSTPDDSLYSLQWAHQLTQAEQAWDTERGSPEVIIAIIDSGIDELHPDLVENLLPGFDFVDVNTSGYDSWELLEGEDYRIQDDDPEDTDGHGTHVAGIAAAKGFDQFGVTGVCPGCSILPLRASARFRHVEEDSPEDTVLTSFFPASAVADALLYAVEQGAHIINMSFGGDDRSPYRDVLQFAYEAGVVLVAAAGNDDHELASYPAFYDEVIAVASTNQNDEKSDFSNFGTWVDMAAPGSNILSTYPEGLGGSVSSSSLRVQGEEIPTTIFTFSGFTGSGQLRGELVFVGLGREADLSNPAYAWDQLPGNIALIRRGEITFREKVDRVKQRGAVGVVIFNHSEGPIFGTLGVPRENPLPVLGIGQADGEKLLAQLDNGKVEVEMKVEQLSDIHAYASGTSMASPYVAGAAGLLLSRFPTLSNEEVRRRLLYAVTPLDDHPGQLGSGRINLARLFDTPPPPGGELGLLVYPNPATTSITVQLNSEEKGPLQLRLYNLIGSVLQQHSFDKQSTFWQTHIDLGPYSSGMYFVDIRQGGKREVRRVIKQ